MKRFVIKLSVLLAAALLWTACVDMSLETESRDLVPVSIGPAGDVRGTRAEPYGDMDTGTLDGAVSNFMIYLFESDGSLFSRDFVDGNSSVVKYVHRNDEYHIYAVSNLDTSSQLYSRLAAVTTEDGFLDVSYRFSDAWTAGKGWLAKSGQVVRTFTSDSETVTLNLERVVAMITLSKLDFMVEDYDDLENYYTFDGVYLINTVDEMTFGGTALRYTNCSVSPYSDFSESEDWQGPAIDRMNTNFRRLDYYMWDEYVGPYTTYTEGAYRYDQVFNLYCLANPMTETTYGCLDPFSNTPRMTRLVVSLCDNNGPSYACFPLTVKGPDGWLEPNVRYDATMRLNLDSIWHIEIRTYRDGMDWDTGSVLFGSFNIGSWQTGGTYTENL